MSVYAKFTRIRKWGASSVEPHRMPGGSTHAPADYQRMQAVLHPRVQVERLKAANTNNTYNIRTPYKWRLMRVRQRDEADDVAATC